jgi:acetoin utilization deacetylase AcuC-like enzyme
MILRYPSSRAPLTEFGILIPASKNRSERILEALRSVPGLENDGEWLIGPDGSRVTREDLERVHSPEYVKQLFGPGLESVITQVFELVNEDGSYNRYDPLRATRPLSEMFDGSLSGLSGSYQVGKEALSRGFCFYLGGGAHHAHYGFGHGFCIVNDTVIALRKLQADGLIRTAWVVDVDAHKGDGTAALTEGDETITTLSVHTASGWPLDLPRTMKDGSEHPSFRPSNIDIPVAAGEEHLYLPWLGAGLARLASGESGNAHPDIAYVVDGADPYERDELPSTAGLRLSLEQMTARDLLIFETLHALGIPQAWLQAGGYGEHAWEPYPPFLAHALTVMRSRGTR